MKLPNIPKDVWDARPLLVRIRARAHDRAAGADSVLWNVLTAVASSIPAHVSYETGIGSPVRPTLIHAPVSGSGGGKSSSVGVALSLLPNLPPRHPLSTGQGLVAAYYGRVPVEQPQPPDKDGNARPPKLVWTMRRVRSNLLAVMGEGEVLFKEMAKAGSTVAPVIRSWWTGEQVGQGNATEGLFRVLEEGTYTGGLILAVQADVVGPLIEDTATGTAQRVVWSSALDPAASFDRPRWPSTGALMWSPPKLAGMPEDWIKAFFDQPSPGEPWKEPDEPEAVRMQVAAEIADRLWRERVARVRGEVEVAEHDSHRPSMLVKISGVLAWLDGRLWITEEDWQLAEQLLSTSDAVRDALLEHAEALRVEARRARGVERAEIDQAATNAQATRERCRERVLVLVAKAEEPMPRREIDVKLSKEQRRQLAAVLADLLDEGALTEVDRPQGGTAYALPPKAERA